MIAVCLPSRGLVHSRTVEHINNNLQGYEYKMYMSHDLPIPDCFNYVAEEALQSNPSHVWFVEEDMGFPDDTLDKMLLQIRDCDAVTLDYRVSKKSTAIRYRAKGDVDYAGMGCLLIKPEALHSTLPFSTEYRYIVGSDEPTITDEPTYGKQDIHMYKQLYKNGYNVQVGVDEAWQYRVAQYGELKTNKGCHDINILA